MARFDPGDVYINIVGIAGSSGSMDLRPLVQTIMVYENITSPYIIAELMLIESQELLAYLPLVGEEMLYLDFQTPSLASATYNLQVTSILRSTYPEGGKTRIYTIRAVSPSVFRHNTTIIQKAYNTNCSQMVQDISQNFLGISNLYIEPTQGIQQYTVHSEKPYTAIKQILLRSSSEQNKSSSYLYYANQFGQDFRTIENLFQQGSVVYYTNNKVVNQSIFNVIFNNIISYQIDVEYDSAIRIGGGANASKLQTFDYMNLAFNESNEQPSQNMKYGGSGGLGSSQFGQAASGSGKSHYIPKSGLIPPTFIPSFMPSRAGYTSNMENCTIKLRVFGNSTIAAGMVAYCEILENTGVTTSDPPHPLIATNYMLNRVCHSIAMPNVKPRYTLLLDGMSGAYAQNPGEVAQ